MSVGEQWLAFGVFGSLLPAFLLVRTLMHVLNIPAGGQQSARR